jgi:hypothetical protein
VSHHNEIWHRLLASSCITCRVHQFCLAHLLFISTVASIIVHADMNRFDTERKLTTGVSTTSIKLPSPAPQSAGTATPTGSRSRVGQQVRGASQQRASQAARAPGQTRRRNPVFTDEEDGDGDGDEALEEGDGEQDDEDKKPYCFCQKQSYGEVCGHWPSSTARLRVAIFDYRSELGWWWLVVGAKIRWIA